MDTVECTVEHSFADTASRVRLQIGDAPSCGDVCEVSVDTVGTGQTSWRRFQTDMQCGVGLNGRRTVITTTKSRRSGIAITIIPKHEVGSLKGTKTNTFRRWRPTSEAQARLALAPNHATVCDGSTHADMSAVGLIAIPYCTCILYVLENTPRW